VPHRAAWPLAVILVCVLSALAAAQDTPPPTGAQNLKRLSIEELSELDVTSVSRRPERLSQTAAAVSIIRQDDIRRSGVTSFAEAMRLGDGVDVARFDARTWAISARGFNITTANKLLVLMDGRTLYSPLFAGTFWEVQDTVLADVDRIEVIRGPGGSVWGANAVNGIVNILTRSAHESRGSVAFIAAGTEDRLIASARHGARMAGNGAYRVYGKYRMRDENHFSTNDNDADDAMSLGQMGFRMDSSTSGATHWTLQGDAYRGSENIFTRDDDIDVAGGNLLGRWVRTFSDRSDVQLQAYYDVMHRDVPQQFEETRHTFDLDTQVRRQFATRHDVVAGAAMRVSGAEDIGVSFRFEPAERTDTTMSLFVQDEISLPRQTFVTVGSKFERNAFTGLEMQPTARFRWSPGQRRTLWGAVSRAVRLPTRFDTDLRLFAPNGRLALSGADDFEAEEVIAYEAGYRTTHPRVSIDIAAFANRYDRLRSQEFPSRLGPVVLLQNLLNARTSGVESAVRFQLTDTWRVHTSATYLHKTVTRDASSRDVTNGASEGNDPSFLFHTRSYLDLPHGFAFDTMFRYVGDRPAPRVEDYAELDVRLGWQVSPIVELSLIGQNLLHDRHEEFVNQSSPRFSFQRGVYVRSAWRF
jgi:iron complex outermembrane receptor protein